jgi:hypothetical protein
MGKTRRKEKIFNDLFDESYEVVPDDSPSRNDRRKKNKPPRNPSSLEEYDRDEDYGSFEKIGRRR